MNIGFIGTGVMGSRMVKRMLEGGYRVTVYNRSPEKLEQLLKKGAVQAESIALLSSQSDVICTCLSMPQDVEDVYCRQDGVLENAKPGTICIDFTTVGVDTSKVVARKAIEREICYLDAPVSGGPEGAEQGSLTIMVGGDDKTFDKVTPILKVLGQTIKYLGQTGSGSVAKLINQYLVAVHSVAASEAMVAGTALGLNSEQLFEILQVSYGDSRMLRRHMGEYILDRQFEPGGAVKYVHKDVKLANPLFEQVGMKKYTGLLAEQSFQEAINQGYADLDMSAVICPLEKDCRVIVKKRGVVEP
ncbi:NAD(P)-dependent oxidoreductase [Alkalihalobacterium elongatum]|uniref:NAD(P)-dependent oxidoreductase n=1 Tax=Alkalihalobacterium elongatum TaxID=2675466 RepID=UPI001C1F83FD|nr:NAD(P)-dependent oxidoreductase [Alkalihalobacterium elongatum]